ncbi:uncharacterized protein [Tenebrio molitor]|uniref:uncharacterized protein isoform X3 n=1 Tax=Tenebrio molitor TaxID=7067 RepID=UPI003624A337
MIFIRLCCSMKSREFYFLLLIEAANAFNNIVTLRKENEVCCITQDVTLATFISPPFTENSTKSLSLLIGEDWSCDNWILTDGSKSLSGSVTDKRWENLDVIKTNYKTFTSVQSVSFSLYSPGEVHLFANDDQDFDYNDLKEFKNGWNHISIFLRNNNVFYLLNNKVIKSVDAFNPHNITIITNNDTLWKIHDYQFIMSEKVTDGKHITLTLPHTENDCFLLYVSLCEKCVLTIPELNRIYNSTNDQSVLNSWQVYQLEIETGLEHLRFYKTTTDNSTLGYWGIDLHECPTNDIVSHKVNAAEIEENNYLCYVLNQEYKMERQMEEDSKSVNVESCEEDLRCKCIWGYTDSYDDINTLTQTDCKEACNLCNKIANKDRTEVIISK